MNSSQSSIHNRRDIHHKIKLDTSESEPGLDIDKTSDTDKLGSYWKVKNLMSRLCGGCHVSSCSLLTPCTVRKSGGKIP